MLTTYVRCKIGFGSGPSAESAAAAAVTAKIEKNEKKSYKISNLGLSMVMISKYDISFRFRIPPHPIKGALRGLRGPGGGVETTEDNLI